MGKQSRVYHATTQRGVLIWLLLFNLLLLSTDRDKTWFFYIPIVVIIATILAMFIKYSFVIRDDKIIFKVLLFNKIIYKK